MLRPRLESWAFTAWRGSWFEEAVAAAASVADAGCVVASAAVDAVAGVGSVTVDAGLAVVAVSSGAVAAVLLAADAAGAGRVEIFSAEKVRLSYWNEETFCEALDALESAESVEGV